MWSLYQRAKTFTLNPSDEMGIPEEDVWLRWMFNRSVHTLGTWVENKLAERDRDGRPLHRLERLLAIPITPRHLSLAQFQQMGTVREASG